MIHGRLRVAIRTPWKEYSTVQWTHKVSETGFTVKAYTNIPFIHDETDDWMPKIKYNDIKIRD